MYSQYGEDDIVAEIVGAATGTVLEIGAWDPVTFSNSRLLIERGWPALLVEPSPGPLRHLVETYAKRDDVLILAAAITTSLTPYLTMDITDDGLSTSVHENREKWRADGGYFGTLRVPSFTAAQLTGMFGGAWDVVSIDTEGTSVDVALQYLQTGARPRALIVEHDNRLEELQSFAGGLGYSTRWTNGTNAILELRR